MGPLQQLPLLVPAFQIVFLPLLLGTDSGQVLGTDCASSVLASASASIEAPSATTASAAAARASDAATSAIGKEESGCETGASKVGARSRFAIRALIIWRHGTCSIVLQWMGFEDERSP